ncbi:ABC transporter F family member 4 [Malaya genurostris]|uniref:ABC transporter F family member 4 n=1 Tax=Malaya genurostris TaxID=325434 RepID=UPI0026F3D863|nr:ABC transporter F family member 4 [Malaya genurostris]
MMSRGGRGYPRGGGTRGGSSYRGGGGYRGSDHSSSYNGRDGSRNRYSGGGGGSYDSRSSRYDSNRYSRQDNRPEGTYKRNDSYKQDSRDRRSPDRKRPRTDHTAQGGRRDYSTGGGGSGDYHRRDSSGGGRGGSSSRYHDSGSSSYDKRGNDHHSSAGGGGGAGSRDRFDNRSSSRGRGISSADRSREPMGPPRSVGPRSSIGQRPPMRTSMGTRPMSSISTYRRGTMRGRINSHFRNDGRRGMVTSRFNNRRDLRGALPLRRRFTTIRQRDGGRIGIGKGIDTTRVSRKALIKRALEAAKDLDDDHTTENEGDDDDEDVDDDKDTTGAEGNDSKKELKEGEEDDGDKTEKEEEDEEEDDDADKKTEKGEDEKEGDEKADESKDGEDADGEKKEGTVSPKKTVKKSVSKTGEKADEKGVEKKKKDTKITTKYRSSSYIKLICCHCSTNCVTFKEYHTHLFRGLHRAAMRRLAGKTRDKLMEMRQAQRVAQKEADQSTEDGGEQKSSYCVLCQLNFRQPKAVHQKSDGHKEMKRFLMPYCATCKIGFKSPMAYEAHRASLEHLKLKARYERYSNKEESGEDGDAELRLENFMTVDEVGNVDEPADCSKESTSTPKKSGLTENSSTGRPGTDEEEGDSDDVDEDTVIGSEHVKKVEVQYCDLCNMYLPRREDPEKVLRMHCKTRSHLRVYIRNREDKKLRERAERIHKKKLSDAKTKQDAKKDASEADTSETQDVKTEKKPGEEGANKDTTTDDQMWEVVDNDLGDLLREVSGPAEDGEEEEDDEKTSSERYDKFRHTEKNGLDKNIHDNAVDEEDASNADKKVGVKKATNGEANCADKEIKVEA